MAITGKFIADFASFSDAVAKAEVQLKGFEQSGSKVATSLTRMSNSLSGTRLIQDATLMAAGVEKIGGVSKLTEKELQRLGAQAQEAAAKMRALGLGVPENLQKIADAAKRAEPPTRVLQSALGQLGAAVAGAFTVRAVVTFGKELLADADALVKLSDKTGLSLQALQKFQIAGDDAGNTIDQMSTAITQLENRMAGGDKSAVGALGKLGLSLDKINALSPENQFIAISDALRKIQDPAQQVNIAMDLFGRQGAEILPTLKRGFDDLNDSVVGMSDRTIKNLDTVSDGLAKFGRDLKATVANAIVDFKDFATHGFSIDATAGARFAEELDKRVAALKAKAQALIDFAKPVTGFVGPTMDAETEAKIYEAALAKQEAAAKKASDAAVAAFAKWKDATRALAAETAGFAKTLNTIDGAVVEAIKVYLEAGVSQANLATAYGLTEEQVKAVAKAVETDTRILELNTSATMDLDAALKSLGKTDDLEIHRLQVIYTWRKKLYDLERAAASAVKFEDATPAQPLPDSVIRQLAEAERRTKAFHDALSDLTGAFAQLAQISGDSWGGMLQNIGKVIGAINLAQQAMEKYTEAVNAAGKDTTASYAAAGSAVMSYYGIVLQFVDFLNKATGLQKNKDVAKFAWEKPELIQAFVESLGNLNTLFERTGVTAEQVQIAIARALSAKTPAEFAAAMRPVIDALNEADRAAQQLEDDLHTGGFLSKDELLAAAKRAQNVYDAVAEGFKKGQFTQEQVNKAFRNFMEALAVAGDAVAKAWLEANAAVGDAAKTAEKAVSAQQKAIDALIARRDELSKGIDAEAWEPDMGSIERAMREERDRIDAQIAAGQAAQTAATEAAASASAEAVGSAATNMANDMGVTAEVIEELLREAGRAAATATEEAMGTAATNMANEMSVTAEEIEEFLRSAGKQGAQAMADAVAAQKFADVHVRIVWDVPDLPPGPGGTGGGGTGESSGTRRTFADSTPELPTIPATSAQIVWDVPDLPEIPAIPATFARIAWDVPKPPEIPAIPAALVQIVLDVPETPTIPTLPDAHVRIVWDRLETPTIPVMPTTSVPIVWDALKPLDVPDIPTALVPIVWEMLEAPTIPTFPAASASIVWDVPVPELPMIPATSARIVWDVPDMESLERAMGAQMAALDAEFAALADDAAKASAEAIGGAATSMRHGSTPFASTFVDPTPELPAIRSSAVSDSHDSHTYQVTVSIHTQARDSAELRHEVSRAGGIAELVAVEIARRQTLAKQYKNSLGLPR